MMEKKAFQVQPEQLTPKQREAAGRLFACLERLKAKADRRRAERKGG